MLLRKLLALAFGAFSATVAAAEAAALDTKHHLQFDCTYLKNTTQPIPDQSVWTELREAYHLALGDSQEPGFTSSEIESGFRIPYEVWQSRGRAPGIFATRNVKRGELVWEARNAAVFHSEQEYRRFLSVLPHDFACNALHWTYLSEDSRPEAPPDNTYLIGFHMDDSALIVEADQEEDVNVGCNPEEYEEPEPSVLDEGGYLSCCDEMGGYALRDIEAGEELLEEYGDYVDSVPELTWWAELCESAIYDGDWGDELNDLYTAEKMSLSKDPQIDCMHLNSAMQPIPDRSMWNKLRDAYHLALGVSREFREKESAYVVPYEVRQSPGKGRGIFVTRSVRRGELIERGEAKENAAMFHHEHEYKRFLSLLPHDLACNVLHWSYLSRDCRPDAPEDTYVIKMHMDDSIFINFADHDGGANYGDKPKEHKDCFVNATAVYALRDIEAGEELLKNPSDFADAVEDELDWLAKLRDDAFHHGDWGAELNALWSAVTPHEEL